MENVLLCERPVRLDPLLNQIAGSSPGAASAQSGFEETCGTKPANPSGKAGIDGKRDERG